VYFHDPARRAVKEVWPGVSIRSFWGTRSSWGSSISSRTPSSRPPASSRAGGDRPRGEIEFCIGGEVRLLRSGEVYVIPVTSSTARGRWRPAPVSWTSSAPSARTGNTEGPRLGRGSRASRPTRPPGARSLHRLRTFPPIVKDQDRGARPIWPRATRRPLWRRGLSSASPRDRPRTLPGPAPLPSPTRGRPAPPPCTRSSRRAATPDGARGRGSSRSTCPPPNPPRS